MTSNDIEAINPVDQLLFSETINSAKGQIIEQVFYAIVNYQERPYYFDGFHLCDQAVLIKLSNGKWLNWVWVEQGFSENPEINITMLDIRNKLVDEYTTVKDVSDSSEWKALIGKEIHSIKFKIIDIDETKKISDLKFTINNKDVSICAIDEPDPYKLPKIEGLPFSMNWTIIVFNEEILKEHNRTIN